MNVIISVPKPQIESFSDPMYMNLDPNFFPITCGLYQNMSFLFSDVDSNFPYFVFQPTGRTRPSFRQQNPSLPTRR